MSIFGSDNFGLSDSLIDAVKKVKESGIKIKTNQEAIQEKLSSKEKMKRGLYNDKLDAVGKEDDDVDNDGDVDSSDKYLKKRRMAITKNIKKGKKAKDQKEPENGTADPIDTDPKMDDVKEAKEKKESYLGHSDAEKLNGGKSRDPRFSSAASHIDYHHRQTGGHMKSGGDADMHRHQVAKKLGYHVEAAGSRPQDKKDGDMKPVKQGASDLHNCAEKVMHENWGEGLCMFGEHAEPDENGQVAWYDVMFEHGIEKEVSIEDLKVISEKNHGSAMHSKRKKEDK